MMVGTIVKTLTFPGLLSTPVNIVTRGLGATFITRNTNQLSTESTELNFVKTSDVSSPRDLYQFESSEGSGFQCQLCMKMFSRRVDGKNHCETVHFPGAFEYTCEYCNVRFKSNNTYKLHKSRKHKIVP